jgi:hypothetical protein
MATPMHRNAPLSLEGRRRLVERCQTRAIAHVAAEMGIAGSISVISGFAPDVGMNHHHIAPRQFLRLEEP